MNSGTVLLLPHQERFLQSPKNFPEVRWHFLLAGYGAGKALYYKEITPTPDGFREFGDIRVGDMVFDDSGRPVRVLGVYEQGLLDAYRVTLSDGRSVICSAEHLWGVYYYSHGGLRYRVMELSEMLRKGVRRPDPRYTRAGGKPKFWVPSSPVCFYPDRELPLDPYVLGSLIGNGCLTLPALTLSSADEWQVRKVASRLGAEPRKNKCTYSWTFRRDGHNIKTSDVVPEGLRCLAGHKYIPEEYLMSGEDQRRELLQGLFDTDGSVDSSANRLHVSYSTTSRRLAEDVRNLLLSMGIVSTITEDVREGKNTCYNVIVSTSQERKAWLFSLPRKLSRVTSFPRPDRRDYTKVAVYSVEKLPEKLPMRCIRVDSPGGLFLCRDFIVTHNTRSLAIAALELISEYDGEKDDGGLGVRLAVAGYTYAHLEQTFMIDFKAYLDASKTPYHEDTKNHIITVGTVQVIFLQLCEPARIFGQSVHAALADEVDELEENVMIEAMKSLSQRVRQVVPGHRPPFIMAASTAQGMKGFYRLYSSYKKNGVAFVLVRARTQDNWYLPRDYIEDLWKNFTETERKVYMEGEFLTVAQGRVVPGFDWDRNFVPVDMDLELRPGERVYVGQDINCLRGDTRILTINGEVQIKDIRPGDYVLTRKGFRKVLTTIPRGVKVVSRYNVLFGTKDHVAITPEGDRQLCDATEFYCLPERCISDYARLGMRMERLAGLRTSLMTALYGTGTLTSATATSGITLLPEEEWRNFIDIFIGSFMGRFRSVGMYITKTGSMITGLKALFVSHRKSITESIRLCARLPKFLRTRLVTGIIVRRRLRSCGITDASVARFIVLFVEGLLRQKSILHSIVLSARKPCVGSANMTRSSESRRADRLVTEAALSFVSFVEQRLEELLRQDIARSIRVIGNDQGGQGEKAEVYDLEVEDAHEFFANGILVHNCGYSRGSAWVSRDGVMWCVKSYDFPDIAAAPKVYRHDFPYQDIFWLPDVTSKDMYPQFARELRAYDIHIIHRSKSPLVEDSCFLLSKLCYTGRVKITKQASAVADALATATRDKNNRIPKGVGESSPIHMLDGARYATSYMALVLPEYRDVRGGLMQHLASYRRSLEEDGDNDAPVRYNGAGYTQIEGTAYM